MRDPEKTESMLRAVFGEVHEKLEPGFVPTRDEFVFHMMDWLDDLEQFVALLKGPQGPPEAAARVVVAFLLHAPSHLNAAGRLLLGDVPDAFSDSNGRDDPQQEAEK